MIAVGLTDLPAQPCPAAPVVRLIARSADPDALRPCIREAKLAGRKVILSIGGIGTPWRKPSARAALRLVRSLPAVDEVSWVNEVDLNGWPKAAAYGRDWRWLRRALGDRLLLCDCSPIFAVTWLRAVQQRGGPLPRNPRVAVHPYGEDPLAPDRYEASLGSLGRATARLRRLGIRPRWRVTEVGAEPERADWWWPRALARMRALGIPYVVRYTACGPTWCTV